MKLSIVLVLFLVTTIANAVSYPITFPKDPEEFTTIEGIRFQDVHGASNPPSIPKSWKLISVSNGEKSNSNNLWFQDTDGSIFLLQGFISQNQFHIHGRIYKIPAK